MKLDELERKMFDNQVERIIELEKTVIKLEQQIKGRQSRMIEYELKRDSLLSEIIPASLFVEYSQRLAKI
jgi:hypothetical protein